jgi:hypothetical protein
VLGDDIVISDPSIAEEYLKLLNRLGIPVGLPKSFVSRKGFLNFANQSYLGLDNVSPYSFKEEIAITSSSARREGVLRQLLRGWFGSTEADQFNPWSHLENSTVLRNLIPKILRASLNPFQWGSELPYLLAGRLSRPALKALLTLLSPSLAWFNQAEGFFNVAAFEL